jgi:hypothetical protein
VNLAFASQFHWTPRLVDDLLIDEFWYFLERFDDMAKEEKKRRRRSRKGSKFFPDNMDPTSWIRDPKYKTER